MAQEEVFSALVLPLFERLFVGVVFFWYMYAKRMIYVAKAAFGGIKKERERERSASVR